MAFQARHVKVVAVSEIINTELVYKSVGLVGVEFSTASVEIDGKWVDNMEGFIHSGGGVIADPNGLLELPYNRHVNMWNKYARGDYEGAP